MYALPPAGARPLSLGHACANTRTTISATAPAPVSEPVQALAPALPQPLALCLTQAQPEHHQLPHSPITISSTISIISSSTTTTTADMSASGAPAAPAAAESPFSIAAARKWVVENKLRAVGEQAARLLHDRVSWSPG